MSVKAEIKALIIIVLLAMGVGICIDTNSTRETTTKPCSVVQTETVSSMSDIYEITVLDTDGNLWAYYEDIPREIDDVVVCEFDGDEIISVTERRN